MSAVEASGRGVSRASGGNLPYSAHRESETLNPANPISIKPGKSASASIALSRHSQLNRRLWLRFDRAVGPNEIVTTIGDQTVEMQPVDNKWFVSTDDIEHDDVSSLSIGVELGKGEKSVRWLDAMIRESRE